jgi:flagellar biosynthesis/type III secretory pathway protein FliH
MKDAEVKDLADGRYGIYIGSKLLGIAKTEQQADLGVSLINGAIADASIEAYDDGLEEGRREGYNNGLDDCEDCTGSYDEGFEAGRDEGLADGRSECDK